MTRLVHSEILVAGGPPRGFKRPRSPGKLVLVLVLAAVLAGCTGDPVSGGPGSGGPGSGGSASGGGAESPLADCQGLDASPEDAGAAPTAGAAGALPELTLPCFTGGAPFALADLRGPAVVNLWASWCPPCREELPALQRYADQAAGRVHVLGVVTEDPRRSATESLAMDLGITFPALDDQDGRLWAAVGTVGLPTTLFVDAEGRLRYVHADVLDEQAVERFVAEWLVP